MNKTDKILLIIIFSVFGLFIIGLTLGEKYFNNIQFTYIDLDGNEGIGYKCVSGNAQMTCDLKDGTVIKVKQYKQIEED